MKPRCYAAKHLWITQHRFHFIPLTLHLDFNQSIGLFFWVFFFKLGNKTNWLTICRNSIWIRRLWQETGKWESLSRQHILCSRAGEQLEKSVHIADQCSPLHIWKRTMANKTNYFKMKSCYELALQELSPQCNIRNQDDLLKVIKMN